MPPLRLEIFNDQDNTWHQAGVMQPGDRYGSVSDNTEHGRDIYYFGMDVIEGKAVIKKSLAGFDIEEGELRSIDTLGGLSLLASLEPGEQYELIVKTDKSPKPRKLRFTHFTD
jgi:hypothetical protein